MSKAAHETGAQKHPVSLELAKLFTLVAKFGTIAGAARALNIDSSLATRKLAQLESALGARLVERTTRSMKLTEAGRVALTWANEAVESFEKATDQVASLQARPSGVVRVAVTQYTATQYLPPLLASFCADHPEVSLVLSTTDALVNLIDDSYDVAIHSGQIPNSSMVGKRLREIQRVLCATPDYLAAHGEPARPEDLADHDCLVHSVNEPKNWFFRRGANLVAQPVHSRVESDNYAVLLELARRSMGIVRLGENLVLDDLRAGRLVQVLASYKCVYPNGERPSLWILYPNRRVPYRTRLFIDFMIKSLSR